MGGFGVVVFRFGWVWVCMGFRLVMVLNLVVGFAGMVSGVFVVLVILVDLLVWVWPACLGLEFRFGHFGTC